LAISDTSPPMHWMQNSSIAAFLLVASWPASFGHLSRSRTIRLRDGSRLSRWRSPSSVSPEFSHANLLQWLPNR